MNNLQISSWILKELGCNCERLAQFWDFFLSFFNKIKERIIFKKSQYSSFNLTLLVPLKIFFFGENKGLFLFYTRMSVSREETRDLFMDQYMQRRDGKNVHFILYYQQLYHHLEIYRLQKTQDCALCSFSLGQWLDCNWTLDTCCKKLQF